MTSQTPAHDPVLEFYSQAASAHGFDPRTLGSHSPESRVRRFEALLEVGRHQGWEGKSVLDVGCGFGDFALFLAERGIPCRYVGKDITPQVVELANRYRPQLDIRLLDVLTANPGGPFDYVVGQGFNGILSGRNWELLEAMIPRMYELARLGAAVGMGSEYHQRKDPRNYYASPEEVFRLAMRHARAVTLRHDYLPHDFTIVLHKVLPWPAKP